MRKKKQKIFDPLESEIQETILNWLEYQKGKFWRNNTGALNIEKRFIRFGLKGSSDIIGILPDGRFFACEVKRPGKKPTPDQKTFLETIAYWGGVACVAYSLEDVVNVFKNL